MGDYIGDDARRRRGENGEQVPDEKRDDERANALFRLTRPPAAFVEVRGEEEAGDDEEERHGDARDALGDEFVDEPCRANDLLWPGDMNCHDEHRANDAHVLDLLTCLR